MGPPSSLMLLRAPRPTCFVLLLERLPERQACRVMVELLAMGYERGCESELSDEQSAYLDNHGLPDIAVRARPLHVRSRTPAQCRRPSGTLKAYETHRQANHEPAMAMRHEEPLG